MGLSLRPSNQCEFDCVSLGEVMLRLDPGEGRVRNARSFHVWEGGGEYNVARGLRRCFGKRTAIVTAFVDNGVGRLAEDLILQGGVDDRFINWSKFDGVGRSSRIGLNFTERGFGIRAAKGISDRGNSAASQMKPGDIDWDDIFGNHGTLWFHTGGIFAALSDSTAELTIEACQKAKEHGVIVSYDLNYRPSLWNSIGGQQKAQEVNLAVAPFVDVMLGNEEDFTACLGLEVAGMTENLSGIEEESYRKMISTAVASFPNFRVVATTLREVITATKNNWSAIAWHEGQFYSSKLRPELEIMDRVGGGDSFASGFIFGFLEFNDVQQAVEYGAAHGALAMTTPGDTSMAILSEVEKLVAGGSARVER